MHVPMTGTRDVILPNAFALVPQLETVAIQARLNP
jgi:hypothetical protein